MRRDPEAIDLENRADHLRSLLCALSLYMTAVLDDTAQNALAGSICAKSRRCFLT